MANKNWLGDKIDKDGWPVAVPILTEDDFCRGRYKCGNKLCMLGWARAVTGPSYNEKEAGIRFATFFAVIRETLNGVNIVPFNDFQAKPGDRPQVWNKTMRRLGYDVPKSACK